MNEELHFSNFHNGKKDELNLFTIFKNNSMIKKEKPDLKNTQRVKPSNYQAENPKASMAFNDTQKNTSVLPAQVSKNQSSVIPKEKKEQERLKRATGEYDLKKVDPTELKKHINLPQKTPDDYYRENVPDKEMQRRLNTEALGPKTDFSINNFEKNYNKMNKEEQEMITYKMQLDFNNLGYRDKDGLALKTDGVFGKKTKAVYDKYKEDNIKEIEDDLDKKNEYGYSVLANEDGKPILFASTDLNFSKYISDSKPKIISPDEIVKNKKNDKSKKETVNIKTVNTTNENAKKSGIEASVLYSPKKTTLPGFSSVTKYNYSSDNLAKKDDLNFESPKPDFNKSINGENKSNKQEKLNNREAESQSSSLWLDAANTSDNSLAPIREKEDDKLESVDKKMIDSLIYAHNLSNNTEEKEAYRRVISKIRQQEKYKSLYENSDSNGIYIDRYNYTVKDSNLVASANVLSEGMAWLEGGENKKNDNIMKLIGHIPSGGAFDFFDLIKKLIVEVDKEYFDKASELKEGDIMISLNGYYSDSPEHTTRQKQFYRDKRGNLYRILSMD